MPTAGIYPSSLHVSNIANVAYGFAKIQRAYGQDVRVLCHDYGHVMSQPEWDDLLLDPSAFHEEWNFHNNSADLSGYQRPDWYNAVPVVDPFGNLSKLRENILRKIARITPRAARRILEPVYYKSMGVRHALLCPDQPVAKIDGDIDSIVSRLVKKSAEFGPSWQVDEFALRRFAPYAGWMSTHSRDRDVVFAHALSPIYAMLASDRPYIGVEIGIMRDIPYGSSAMARVLWLSFRLADAILITNPDNRSIADNAGIERYAFCPHPIDDELYSPGSEPELRAELLARCQASTLVFAPARQYWDIKGNDKYLHAFASCLKQGLDAALLIPSWGQDIKRSMDLASLLGITDRVHWLPPLPERWLARYYRAVDVVIDQFNLGVFGLITAKALSAGKPVITSYDDEINRWAFPEKPPLIACLSADEIASALMRFGSNEALRVEIGELSRQWTLAWHSRRVVAKVLQTAMETAIDHRRSLA